MIVYICNSSSHSSCLLIHSIYHLLHSLFSFYFTCSSRAAYHFKNVKNTCSNEDKILSIEKTKGEEKKRKVMGNGEKNKKKLVNILRWWVKKVLFTNPQGFDSFVSFFHYSFFYIFFITHNKRNSFFMLTIISNVYNYCFVH